jgi:glycosyltransferase involved in cell wall biosynthesis
VTEPAILVLTTVHAPDDTRIRERLVRTLEEVGSVSYATRRPGPSDHAGLRWLPLSGGRLRRNVAAIRLLLGQRWDVAVLHDPELIPAGALARLVRRAPVVFDVHEDLEAQISTKEWVPVWARPVFRWIARVLYRLAERTLVLTLAEPGYRRLFERDHAVFPNHPRADRYPEPLAAGDGTAVYVGDITRARGIEDALAACGKADLPLIAVGRVDETLASELRRLGPTVTLTGPLPNPDAIQLVATASVGVSPLRDEANYRESLPTKTLEYLAMGVPVVATALPGTRSVLQGLDAVWLVPAGDVPAMAQALSEAVRPEARTTAWQQARSIRSRFRWPEEEVRSFYQGLLSRGESPAPS